MLFLTLDNFFKDPAAVREKALAKPFTNKTGHFPGARSVNEFRFPELREFCRKASPLLAKSGELKIQSPCFQFLGKGQRKSYIHSDPMAGYAGIVFLGEKSGTYPGTSFFRHNQTGLDCFKWEDKEWIRKTFPNKAAYKSAEDLLDRDRFNTKKWTRVITLDAAFNRLILFPAELLHQNASAWGTNPRNGRLTYNFWLAAKRVQ
ncbi:MAG: DUF6445 family protein [Bdellovibrionota bacterium]